MGQPPPRPLPANEMRHSVIPPAAYSDGIETLPDGRNSHLLIWEIGCLAISPCAILKDPKLGTWSFSGQMARLLNRPSAKGVAGLLARPRV